MRGSSLCKEEEPGKKSIYSRIDDQTSPDQTRGEVRARSQRKPPQCLPASICIFWGFSKVSDHLFIHSRNIFWFLLLLLLSSYFGLCPLLDTGAIAVNKLLPDLKKFTV